MNKRLPSWFWVFVAGACTLIIGLLDWVTGYKLNFFVFYFLPISIVAWFVGIWAAISITIFSVIVWFEADILSGHDQYSTGQAIWNTSVRLLSFLTIGWAVYKTRKSLDREHDTAQSLRETMSKIKVLEAFLPICANCKKIKTQEGEWQNLEVYIGKHSNTRFSHGYCPECAHKVLQEAGFFNKKPDNNTKSSQ